ncbi:hypothetical protein GJ654_18930 [Rhodoblastus acidophilus]|uniref:Lipoprotein n=1 Tax=Rhodoblastus acidophilus TaxID=1074 RepID=A0A6N8DRH8_RHOAC|nr:hypothetical protein [Rhodoblastus acidophilus]MCW2276403.1 outer membrane murein-binding lipoprotein Lpp [Rhodoblastus acidophilus]MTV33059.1 hypothetical protein [Rhodoblastus acidophilus]
MKQSQFKGNPMSKRFLICATALSSLALAGCDLERVKPMCPQLKTYSRAQLNAVADAYPGLSSDVRAMIRDYRLVRRQIKAICP